MTATAAPPRYDDAAVRRLFDPDTAYASQREAFRCLGEGLADLGPRIVFDGAGGDAVTFSYTARLRPGTGTVCKLGGVNDENAARGLATVQATVVVLDARTGAVAAILDGNAITELRTAAATAVAVRHLAPATPLRVAVAGCGVQGAAHLRALTHHCGVAEIMLWDRDPARAAALATGSPAGVPVTPVAGLAGAVRGADVVVCCTTSPTPLLEPDWVKPGATVVSIGSFAPDRLEVSGEFAARAGRVVVDHLPTALRQAGPVVAAVADHGLDPSAILELGAVVAHGTPARAAGGDIVFYNSVGLGVQDAAAALAILERAAADSTAANGAA
ncbi:ornithine cyclodeaminase family protein [Phytohabitans sp. ZYX-F-186]|uniref:Ornithine cyclodeaminase family protein n=1 Tax=Phytohabitans maris TaxID=3071409 RepID=A0ABU0ZNG3_9ACTN|nr:ornithine cyclodeaminase family protein [Phytohabitans sp. ZYX-F-186]MDQ7908498.1 ornithine cyclodeaminase family protein [Phytohabitans sp. ZYX-F-186]